MKWFAKKVFDGGGNNLKNQRKSSCYFSRFAEKLKLLPENLKNLFKKLAASVNCRSAKNPFTWFFRKKSTGAAILETAMTLPIVLYVIFFAIELVRMELAQTAVDAITKECTFSLMANGNVSNFDNIFAKYKPWGIPIGNFRFYCRLYPHMTSPDGGTTKGVMDVSPYGGETIGWVGTDYANPSPNATPIQKGRDAGGYGSGGNDNQRATFSKYRTRWTSDSNFGEVGYIERRKLLDGEKSSSGHAFVLTVAVKFPFSSPFIAKLFNGGSNTDKPGVYILWARGSGMIN